jgi:hypothetical protein
MRADLPLMDAEERAKFDPLNLCRACGRLADWGSFEEGVAFCQEHAPWVDRELAEQVSRAVTYDDLVAWLHARPPMWRAKWQVLEMPAGTPFWSPIWRTPSGEAICKSETW